MKTYTLSSIVDNAPFDTGPFAVIFNGVSIIRKHTFKSSTIASITFINSPHVIIEEFAFHGCELLNSIKWPPSVDIDQYAFAKCGFSTLVYPNLNFLPEYRTDPSHHIGHFERAHRFQNCHNLRTIVFPDYVSHINTDFDVTVIRPTPFTTLKGGANVTRISNNAFLNFKLDSDLSIFKSLERIGAYAFAGCSLKNLSLPESTQLMGPHVFADNAFTQICIHFSVLPSGTFRCCRSLELVLAPNLSLVGEKAFSHCALTHLPYTSSPMLLGYSCFERNNFTTLTLNRNGPSGVTCYSSAAGCFANCLLLEEVTINIPRLRDSMFSHCKLLTKVHGMSHITLLPKSVFMSCSSLKNISLDSITEILPHALDGCKSLSASLPKVTRCFTNSLAHVNMHTVRLPNIASVLPYSFSGAKIVYLSLGMHCKTFSPFSISNTPSLKIIRFSVLPNITDPSNLHPSLTTIIVASNSVHTHSFDIWCKSLPSLSLYIGPSLSLSPVIHSKPYSIQAHTSAVLSHAYLSPFSFAPIWSPFIVAFIAACQKSEDTWHLHIPREIVLCILSFIPINSSSTPN